MLEKWGLLMDDWSYKNGIPSRRAVFVGWTTIISLIILSLITVTAMVIGIILLFKYSWLFALMVLFVGPLVLAMLACFIMIITYKIQPDTSKDIPPDIETVDIQSDADWNEFV